jgi:hypothetical protein
LTLFTPKDGAALYGGASAIDVASTTYTLDCAPQRLMNVSAALVDGRSGRYPPFEIRRERQGPVLRSAGRAVHTRSGERAPRYSDGDRPLHPQQTVVIRAGRGFLPRLPGLSKSANEAFPGAGAVGGAQLRVAGGGAIRGDVPALAGASCAVSRK